MTNLIDSKLYSLARTTDIFGHLKPAPEAELMTGLTINDDFPRKEGDTSTRIFIFYVNLKKNASCAMISDTGRLDSTFKIDEFIQNYGNSISEDGQTPFEDPIDLAKYVIHAALQFAASVVLGFEDKKIMKTAELVLSSVVSAVYDDPLDVAINVTDYQSESGDIHVLLKNIWTIESRQK